MIRSWFHCGNVRDDGNERMSTRSVIAFARSIASTSSKSRLECPIVQMAFGALNDNTFEQASSRYLGQRLPLVGCDVIGLVTLDLVLRVVLGC